MVAIIVLVVDSMAKRHIEVVGTCEVIIGEESPRVEAGDIRFESDVLEASKLVWHSLVCFSTRFGDTFEFT